MSPRKKRAPKAPNSEVYGIHFGSTQIGKRHSVSTRFLFLSLNLFALGFRSHIDNRYRFMPPHHAGGMWKWLSLLRRGSNVRYINPLCEVCAGVKLNGSIRRRTCSRAFRRRLSPCACTYITQGIIPTRKNPSSLCGGESENSEFSLKKHQMFSDHTTPKKASTTGHFLL